MNGRKQIRIIVEAPAGRDMRPVISGLASELARWGGMRIASWGPQHQPRLEVVRRVLRQHRERT